MLQGACFADLSTKACEHHGPARGRLPWYCQSCCTRCDPVSCWFGNLRCEGLFKSSRRCCFLLEWCFSMHCQRQPLPLYSCVFFSKCLIFGENCRVCLGAPVVLIEKGARLCISGSPSVCRSNVLRSKACRRLWAPRRSDTNCLLTSMSSCLMCSWVFDTAGHRRVSLEPWAGAQPCRAS